MKQLLLLSALLILPPLSLSATSLANLDDSPEAAEKLNTSIKKTLTKENRSEVTAGDFDSSAIKELIKGELYTGEGKTEAGENLYFAIEKLNTKRYRKWYRYFNFSRLGIIPCYITKNPERRVNHKTNNVGFTEKESKVFCDLVTSRFAKKDKEELSALKEGFMGGLTGAESIYDEEKYYMAYTSKKPIKGFFQHPKPLVTLKDFHEGYKHLLMTVRSVDMKDSYKDTVVFNNRGIFRSLLSFIEGGYKGLALKLHGFTAAVFKEKFAKTHMSVAPMPRMLTVMEKNISAEHIMKKSDIPDNLNHFAGLSGVLDSPMVVNINALASFYNESYKRLHSDF